MIQVLAEKITYWDIQICSRIFGWNGKRYLDRLMLILSRSGDGYLYVPFAALLFVLDFSVAAFLVPAAAAAFLIELPVQKLIKSKVKRSRPFEALRGVHHLIKPPDKFSFPSGHTAGAFILASLLAFYYPLYSVAVFGWASGVGVSRVYNGVHYPTDVIAGAILGMLSAYAGAIIVALGVS